MKLKKKKKIRDSHRKKEEDETENKAQGAEVEGVRLLHQIAQRCAIRAGEGCACNFNPVVHHCFPRG